MAKAKKGDTVKVHYAGKLEDGKVFDTSLEREPLQFKIGEGQVIPGFEEAVIDMDVEETKTANIPSDKAYGPNRKDLIIEVDRKNLPADLKPEAGKQLQIRKPDGQLVLVMVTDVTESKVTLDANHPLAGKNLIFEIKLVEIV